MKTTMLTPDQIRVLEEALAAVMENGGFGQVIVEVANGQVKRIREVPDRWRPWPAQ